jgi:hypothetical protein
MNLESEVQSSDQCQVGWVAAKSDQNISFLSGGASASGTSVKNEYDPLALLSEILVLC